jgi:arylsulfatase A-like enzyme
MLPTFAELTSAAAPEGDGISIAPTLTGMPDRQKSRSGPLYWEAAPQQAVRLGDYKAYRAAADRPVELYNLAEDIGETRDLADSHRDMAAKLTALMASSRTESPDFPLEKKRAR